MKCRRCGDETINNRSYCRECLLAFIQRRQRAFDKAMKKLGPLTAENHAEFVKLVLKLEKQEKQEKQ